MEAASDHGSEEGVEEPEGSCSNGGGGAEKMRLAVNVSIPKNTSYQIKAFIRFSRRALVLLL